MTEKEIFESLRNEWNKLSGKTWDAIKDVFKRRNVTEMDLDDVTINISGSEEAYDETMVKITYDKECGTILLYSKDGEEYNPGELSRGEELWVLWELIS